MSRQYFNGVSQISYNGFLMSFVITDTQSNSGSVEVREKVVELISELETVEGVCRYLLGEIEAIRKVSSIGQDLEKDLPKSKSEPTNELKIGLRLNRTSNEHGTT